MIEQLAVLTLAALGGWDILRRLLPVKLPPAAGKIVVVVLAWLLITRAARDIVLSLGVPGSLLLVSRVIDPEPSNPWGNYLTYHLARFRHARKPGKHAGKPPQRAGHRLPRL